MASVSMISTLILLFYTWNGSGHFLSTSLDEQHPQLSGRTCLEQSVHKRAHWTLSYKILSHFHPYSHSDTAYQTLASLGSHRWIQGRPDFAECYSVLFVWFSSVTNPSLDFWFRNGRKIERKYCLTSKAGLWTVCKTQGMFVGKKMASMLKSHLLLSCTSLVASWDIRQLQRQNIVSFLFLLCSFFFFLWWVKIIHSFSTDKIINSPSISVCIPNCANR